MSDTDTETIADDAQIDQDATEPTEQADDSADDDSDAQDESGTPDDDTPDRRRGVRQRLADAEELAEGLRDTLNRQRQAVFDAALSAAGVDPRLLASAGHTPDSLLDVDGVLHGAAVAEVAKAVADEFKVQPVARRPAPDPLVGSGEPGKSGETGWGAALKGALSPG